MAIVNNALLKTIQALIGIAPAASPTVLDDDSISMVLPVLPDVARRGLSVGAGGQFQAIMENVHSAADAESSVIDPYNADDTAVPPFPAVVSRDFDIWLIRASMVRTSGAGTLVGGVLKFQAPLDQSPSLGIGIDDAGAPVTNNTQQAFCHWDLLVSGITAVNAFGINAKSGQAEYILIARLPFGSKLHFHTEAGTASATFRLTMVLGLFPAGLGQDCAA